MKKFAAFLVLAALTAAPAAAFTIFNHGTHTIVRLYYNNIYASGWGPERLQGQTIAPGQYDHNDANDCGLVNIELWYDDNHVLDFDDYDSCAHDLTVTY
jgi:hypothetical protein